MVYLNVLELVDSLDLEFLRMNSVQAWKYNGVQSSNSPHIESPE